MTMVTTTMVTTTTDGSGSSSGSRVPETHRAGGLRRTLLSARARILGWYVLLLAGSSFVSALAVHQVLDSRLDREIEAGLVQETQELQGLAGGRNPATGQPFGDDVAALFDTFLRRNIPGEGEALFTMVDGRPYRTSPKPPHNLLDDPALVARWSALAGSERAEVASPAGEARYLAVPLAFGERQLGTFVVANFPANEQEEIRTGVWVVGTVSGGVLVAASILAWLAAGRVLGPLRLVTSTARHITDTDISQRLTVRGSDEIAELTATFNAMLDRLEASFAGQRAFLHDAGHELRTSITIVKGHLELMGDDPDDQRETLALVNDELDRMTRYVRDLLVLAAAEQPDFLNPEPIDLKELTETLVAKARAFAPGRISLETTGAGVVVADRDRLTQAMMNLAHNAAHHTGESDQIRLGSGLVDGDARFWVADTGPGIPLDDHTRVFERFGRGGDTARRDGTGLGLAIVAAIARAHRGRVELTSRAGEGTTFTIVIPAAPEQAHIP